MGTTELNLWRLFCYTFFEDKVIATMCFSQHNLFSFMNQQIIHVLQQYLIPKQIIDVTDLARRINPYLPLYYLHEDEEESKKYEELYWERMNQLRPISDTPAVLIESIYVKEDCRRHGIMSMMLDMITPFEEEDTVMWLNMQPTDDDLLTQTDMKLLPVADNAEVAEMSLNAHIAEKAGFTVEPDQWLLTVSFTNERGFREFKSVLTLKCAYKFPAKLSAILEKDGDLVAMGRAYQQMIQGDGESRSKMKFIEIIHNNSPEIECPFCGKKILDAEEFSTCPHVMFGVNEIYPLYIRSDLPWTFGTHPPCPAIPMKPGDFEKPDGMSVESYIADIEYRDSFCYELINPDPRLPPFFIAFTSHEAEHKEEDQTFRFFDD